MKEMMLDPLDFAFRGTPLWRAVSFISFLVVLRLLWITIYRLHLHPLAKYPGPLIAKLTGLYFTVQAIKGRDTYARYDLHRKYGSVVRTGPNELTFSDLDSIKDIYGQTAEPCLKAPFFYDGFTLTGAHSVFSATNRSDHARMRRLLSNGLSQQGVLKFESEIVSRIERFLDIIRTSAQPVELHDLAHNLFLDTTSQLSFAKSFDLLSGKPSQGAKDIETYFSISPLFGMFPLARYLPFGIFLGARKAQPRIIQFVKTCLNDFRKQLREGTSQYGLLRLMIEAKNEEQSRSFSDEELIENAVIFIIAGSGTTASTLLYLIYEISKRPDMQCRLEEEIRSAFSDQNVFPDFDTATKLEYLNSVIQEVLRLRGPIPTFAPRVSPGKTIGHEYIPKGVIVSNLAYSTQRNPIVFPDPHEFKPERWTAATPEMKSMNRPFNTGPRNCIGMHLARMQLLLVVCALYQRFEVTVDPSITEEMMFLRDQGVMNPIGKKLLVHARPRES